MNTINPRRAATGLVIAAVAVIALATLTPRAAGSPTSRWWCLFCGELGGVDFLQNVVLFLPLGAALAWRGVSGRHAIMLGGAFTIAIEAAQLALIAGRDASLGDVVANTLGTAVGRAVVVGWRAWWWPVAGAWDRSLSWAAVVLVAVAGGAGLVEPGYGQAAWYGQLTPTLGHLDQFSGAATEPRLNESPLPVGGRPIAAGGGPVVSLSARVTAPGRLTDRVAPIVSVFDGNRAEQVLLGQQRDRLVFRARTGANRWRLHSIAVALPGVFTASSRGELAAAGRRDGADLVVSATDGSGRRETRLRVTAGLGWTALLPVGYVHVNEWLTTGASALWLAVLAAPLGWFAQRRRTAVIAAVVVVAALGAPAGTSGLALPGPIEWLGLVGGWVVGRRLRIDRREGGLPPTPTDRLATVRL